MIISLTSVPPRFDKLDLMLGALSKQMAPEDELRVYIPRTYRRFPVAEASPSFSDTRAQVRQVEEDQGPATKILPCLVEEAANPDAAILYCDDDRLPPPGWLDKFRRAAETYPDRAIAAFGEQVTDIDPSLVSSPEQPKAERKRRKYTPRQYAQRTLYALRSLVPGARTYKPSLNHFRESGFVDVAHGAGGVLVRPRFFTQAVFSVPEYAFFVDDVWISGQLALGGAPIWVDRSIEVPRETEVSNQDALVALEVENMKRLNLNQRCAQAMSEAFGIWRLDAV